MNDDKIEKLWKWFSSNERQIINCIEKESSSELDYIVEHLDNLILDLGVFYWEIGPSMKKSWYLTISPNGDKDLMKKSKKLIASAPDLVEWEFNFCKPAKDWDRKFMIYDDNNIEQKINALNWKYVALQNEDGMIEIILEAKNIGHLDSHTARTAADLVVLTEIGEEAKILNIRSIDIVDQLESAHDLRKAEIKYLRKHVDEFRTLPNKG